jgi:hypothetical protein
VRVNPPNALANVAQVHTDLESRKTIGNFLLAIGDYSCFPDPHLSTEARESLNNSDLQGLHILISLASAQNQGFCGCIS